MRPVDEAIMRGEVVIIDDVRADTPLGRAFQLHAPDLMDTRHSYIRSWMGVPIAFRGRLMGILLLTSSQPNFYTRHHSNLALAVAQHAAVAMENARLYEQSQELAALEERQRLARELHDSVTQALYGIGLAAETTRLLLEQDPARAAQSNATVQSLARAGMAEMRALLFELRPESLELEGLSAALKKQAAALEARYEVPIETTLCEEPSVSLPVKEALYRIAQEALQNAIKHAQPTTMEVRLDCAGREVVLEVQDDGTGFDPSGSFPGHLGLRSMKERATKLGGTLEIKSTPGKGTRVQARLSSTGRP
jgi:signal transduction histidine kinase